MEGIEEALYWHTVGIVADLGGGLGTAVAIRFHKHSILLTANHVVRDTADKDLRFFFRPPGTLKRNDWWQSSTPAGRIESSWQIQILGRFQHPTEDLAALIVSPILEEQNNIRFYELGDTSRIPKPLPSVAAIGFPADTKQLLGPNARVVAAAPLWGNIERGKHWQPSDYNPRSQLLLKFLPADLGRHPGGFSGAGIWYHSPTPKPGVWFPNLGLAGICTHYYPGKKLLLITRIERLVSFLKRIAPP